MAEKVVRRLKSTHESSTLKHGTFGTAIYTEKLQKWSFLRSEILFAELHDRSDLSGQSGGLVILSEPELIAKSVPPKLIIHNEQSTGKNYDANLRTALPFVETSGIDEKQPSTVTSWFSLGSALWLSADGIDSGNLTVPVSAYVTGDHAQHLNIAGHGRQIVDSHILEGVNPSTQIPQILAGALGSWSNGQTIEQVVFSRRNRKLSNGSFLAVRHTSGTSIFQPLLKKGTSDAPGSLIEPNILVTIPISSTGGYLHSHVVFAPHDQHVFAIIDIQGNWSSWKVNGRRSRSARIVSQATLLASGKLFSWEDRLKPAYTEIYFDGWHTAMWMSEDNEMDVDLLICNRCEAKVIKMGTDTSATIDLRLDTNKMDAFILDAKPGPTSQTCLLLTTQRVLLYDFTREDWKSPQSPALMCAWFHARSAHDMTLKLTTFETTSGLKLVLYSGHSSLLTIYDLRLSQHDATIGVSSSLSINFSIPRLASARISSIIFASCETSSRTTRSEPVHNLHQIIIQHDDLTIFTALASTGSRSITSARPSAFALSLPPSRSLAHYSERYIDWSEDEAGAVEWITDSQVDSGLGSQTSIHYDSIEKPGERQGLPTKPFEMLSTLIDRSKSHDKVRTEVGLLEALRCAEARREGSHSAEGGNRSCLLIEALGSEWRIDDVDNTTAAIHEITANRTGQNRTWVPIESSLSASSLRMPNLYEHLFTSYISRLSSAIPSRSRVTRERAVREISFELSMSALMQRRQSMMAVRSRSGLENSQFNSQVQSDPILPPEEDHLTNRPVTFASQPEYRTNTSLSSSVSKAPEISPASLNDTLSRLANLTKIEQTSLVQSSINEQADKNICSLLHHIPIDLDSHPDDYDWQAHKMSDTIRKGRPADLESTAAARKREKLARAQKRAELLLPKSGKIIPLISSATSKGDAAVLSIRSRADASGRPSGLQQSIGSQPAMNGIMSDGILQSEDFSEIEQMEGQTSATQPVRGTYARRMDMGATGRAKKKRRAGF